MSWALKSTRTILNSIKLLQLYSKHVKILTSVNTNNLLLFKNRYSTQIVNPNLNIVRYKHDKKKSGKQDVTDSSGSDTSDNDEIDDKHSKIVTVKVNSLRVDLILKSGLGIARNKIETMFYESKIRVNGKKIVKKSTMANIGDEVDIVRGQSATNENFLNVSRIEILSATEKGEGLAVKLRRNKSLLIENYESENAYK